MRESKLNAAFRPQLAGWWWTSYIIKLEIHFGEMI